MPKYRHPQWEAYRKASTTSKDNHKAARQILRILARARRTHTRFASDPANGPLIESLRPVLAAWASSQVSKYHACLRRIVSASDLSTLYNQAIAETTTPKEAPK